MYTYKKVSGLRREKNLLVLTSICILQKIYPIPASIQNITVTEWGSSSKDRAERIHVCICIYIMTLM